MLKKDITLGLVIGGAAGLLMQLIITNIGKSVSFLGTSPSFAMRFGIFLAFLAAGPLGIAIGYLLGKIHPVIYQFTKFGAAGTLNSFIDLGAINLLITVTGITAGYGYALFAFIGFLLATTNSFIWNKFWTFGAGEGGVKLGQTFAFYGITAIGALLNVGMASFIVNSVASPGLPPAAWANVGGLAGILAAFAWNFLGYKFFVFRKHAAARSEGS